MNRLKSTLTCSYCSKIFKDPIELPCSHNLCKEHLAEKNENKIKCAECKKDFEVRDNDFKSNTFAKKQLDDHVYLSDEELSLKKQIEGSIRMFFQLYEQFTLKKTKLDLDVHNHFQEIRFKLDEHRETLKGKIDDIYMEMIEKTKKFEASYLKSLEDKLEPSLKSFETKSLEQSLKETDESFRNPNLLLESIREIPRTKEEVIVELKMKLDEQSQAKNILIKMNEFTPNVSFSQDSFGVLHLNEYSIIGPFKSQILSDKQSFDLIKICEFTLKDKWTLLYRGSRDGFAAANFHSKCDGHSNTLTLLKANGTSYIFGGFTSINWDSSSEWKFDSNAFLFSLTNKDNQPCKMRQINTTKSIFCRSDHGPTFGSGADISIRNNANTTACNYSNLGVSYEHPQPEQGESYLAGAYKFQLSEIEVYKKD
jgi:hypothetical protein